MDSENKILTGQKDADLSIMNNMDDKTLFSFCMSSNDVYLQRLCNDENFWTNKFLKKYDEQILSFKNPKKTIKRFYLQLSYYDDKYLSKEIEVPPHLKQLLGKNRPTHMGGVPITEEMITNLKRMYVPTKFDDALREAARGGMADIDVVNYLIVRGATDLNPGMIEAAFQGNKKLVEFFIRKGANDMNSGLASAIKGNKEELIQFFRSRGGIDTSRFQSFLRNAGKEETGVFY
jgi:hypothetical protein